MTPCPICERLTETPTLCATCASSPALRAAFFEGRDRRSGWEPLSVLGPMTDVVAEVVATC